MHLMAFRFLHLIVVCHSVPRRPHLSLRITCCNGRRPKDRIDHRARNTGHSILLTASESSHGVSPLCSPPCPLPPTPQGFRTSVVVAACDRLRLWAPLGRPSPPQTQGTAASQVGSVPRADWPSRPCRPEVSSGGRGDGRLRPGLMPPQGAFVPLPQPPVVVGKLEK